MRRRLLALTVAILTLVDIGCAAGIRAGGRHAGVAAGAAIDPPPVVAPLESQRLPEGK